jgi:hypothetical protein
VPIGEFGSDSEHESLDEAVRPRAARRYLHDFDASVGQDSIERRGKPTGSVADDEPWSPTESTEFLAGFWPVYAETSERAVRIAAKVPAAPGQGGVPIKHPIEVRRGMSAQSVEV